MTIRHRLAALSLRFEFLCERNAVAHNPIKGKRDRAILATLLYHALRRDELCRLKIQDAQHERRGGDDTGPLFRPVHRTRLAGAAKAITPDGVYKLVRGYSAALGFEIGAQSLLATAATNALAGRPGIGQRTVSPSTRRA